MAENIYDTIPDNVYDTIPDEAPEKIETPPRDLLSPKLKLSGPKFFQPSRLSEDQTDTGAAEALSNMSRDIGSGLHKAGDVLYEGGVAALQHNLEDFGGLPPDTAANPGLTTEQATKTYPTPVRAGIKGVEGLVRSAPQMAVAAVDPLLGAAAFGMTPEGFDPKQAVIAAALPILGKYSGALTEAIATKAGVTSDIAQAAFNKLGGASGAAALIGADQAREISRLPKGQQKDAWIDAAGNVGSMFLLGTLGERHKLGERTPNEKLKSIQALAPEDFFSMAAQWSKDTMAGKQTFGPQLQAELLAKQHPVLEDWEAAANAADVESRALRDEAKANPEKMGDTAFQKKYGGAAQRSQFFNEGRDVLNGKKQFDKRVTDHFEANKPSPEKGTVTPPEGPVEQPRGTPAAPELTKAHDWTSATEDATEIATPGPSNPGEKPPDIIEYHAGIPIPKFENRKMSELDRVTTNRSAKLQKSFDEARRAQKEINRVIPDRERQSAASFYREANGDMAVLKDWETRAKQKWMRDGAKLAQTLTPEEIAIVNKSASAFDVLERRGNKYDVLKSHRDNYIPHVWGVKQPGAGGLGGSQLKQRFKFSKARTFDTFFDGDQAGFKPKTVALGDLLPAYLHEMNRTIADRQAVQELVSGKTKDGEPLAVPRGNAKVVDGPGGQAVLVTPKALKDVDTSHYKVMENQPALSNWTWAGKDTDGNPIFMKSDLAVHPDVYRRLHSILGESALRQWYRDKTGGISNIPKAILHGADIAGSAMKREMFGFLAPFHQVQEGTHAVGHAVNPFFGIPKVDLRDPGQLDAAKHGLMLLPDRSTSQHYLEGVGAKTSLISKGLRKTGKAGKAVADVIDGYQDYLFHQYIPGLKYKTYQAILERNLKRYHPEIAKGELNESDVKILSAEQSNAAYGHLNYALLDRNPTIQHIAQLTLLAPDFLEARGRFAGQAFKGLNSKNGTEQLRAVATLAVAQAGSAFVLSQLLGDKYDPKHPFEVIHNGRRYAMRSVPEDIFSAIKDTRQFVYSRVNPLTVKGAIQLATGLNYRGEKTTATETLGELLAGYIPITARSIPGLRSLTETGKNASVTPLEQLAGSLGVRVSRYSPISETYKLAGDWMDSQKMARDKGSYPVSKYQQLRYALEDGDEKQAKAAYDELKKTAKPGDIAKGFHESVTHAFTGSKANDVKFAASLKGYERALYDEALRKRQRILQSFHALKK